MSARATIVVVVASALALPAATGARADPCAADERLVNAWQKVLDGNSRITSRQTAILSEIFRRLSTNQTIPRELIDELRSLVVKNGRLITAGERRIVAIRPGTANGRDLKRLALRFLRVVARPLNRCLGLFVAAESRDELDGVVRCIESASRSHVALSRDIDRSLKRMRSSRSICAPRP